MAIKEILRLTLGKTFFVDLNNKNNEMKDILVRFETLPSPGILDILNEVDIPEEYKDKIREAVKK